MFKDPAATVWRPALVAVFLCCKVFVQEKKFSHAIPAALSEDESRASRSGDVPVCSQCFCCCSGRDTNRNSRCMYSLPRGRLLSFRRGFVLCGVCGEVTHHVREMNVATELTMPFNLLGGGVFSQQTDIPIYLPTARSGLGDEIPGRDCSLFPLLFVSFRRRSERRREM